MTFGGMIGSIGGVVSGAATTSMVAARRVFSKGKILTKDKHAADALDEAESISQVKRPPRWLKRLKRFCFALIFAGIFAGFTLSLVFIIGSITVYFGNKYGDAGFITALFVQFILIGAGLYAYSDD